jgi:hypothetical protein
MDINAKHMDVCTIVNHRLTNHFFLLINANCQPCQMQCLFQKVEYIAYFSVNHQNMELTSDQTGLQLKEKVHVSLEAHQSSILNMAQNTSICELNSWPKMSH